MRSAYYPPRARWHSPLLNAWTRVCRKLALDRIRISASVPFTAVVACFFVPGLAYLVRLPKPWGIRLFAACYGLAAFGIVWLGYWFGNLAFGLLLSAHVTGFTMLFEPQLANRGIGARIRFSLASMFVVALGFYLPVRQLVEHYWLLPLRVRDQVMIINRRASPARVQRGDWIACRIENGAATGVILQEGYGLGPVLAVPGDALGFTPSALEINGEAHPRLPGMPDTGGKTIPDGTWFIWPDMERHMHGNVDPANIERMLLDNATVYRDQFVGRPFNRWFFRRQTPQQPASAGVKRKTVPG